MQIVHRQVKLPDDAPRVAVFPLIKARWGREGGWGEG